ncbi:acylphosphatase [Methanoculleus bourgensis MS2]|uniref:Acylphosphatase n=1 Tax=Methanoculleus bourgensis (strain ATCC 43281 / DSM 3045 / OCM 15 / MS2) TaxID=1201294 RepID=I7LKN6_METBM|nr:acylphosphatase [Methanoculleus bourgensis MS2]
MAFTGGAALPGIDKSPAAESMNMAVRVRVWISGLVQGVGFRWAVEDEARAEGVTGWVRNLPDGRVEAVFEGDEVPVRRVVEFCRRGPALARVDDVEAVREEYSGEFEGFSIRR